MGGCYGGGARSEVTGRDGGAGDAEIAWDLGGGYGGGARLEGKVCLQMGPEEPNQLKVEFPIFREKMGLYFCIFFGCGAQGDRYGMWCPV